METKTLAKAKLIAATTAELIAQYDKAISTYRGRGTNHSPNQKRIDYIISIISERADNGDTDALAWYDN